MKMERGYVMENIELKNQRIEQLIQMLSDMFKDIPEEMVISVRKLYMNDKRTLSDIEKEILVLIEKLKQMEQLISKDVDSKVMNNSIILIGPMGVGKSTVSKELCKRINLPRVSLDNRDQLARYYSQRDKFSHFKEFEFYLTASVLTDLKKPAIIDFGAGHSIYENPIMFFEMKKLITRFSNVIFLIPSKNKEEAIEILNERISKRDGNIPRATADNRHFIERSNLNSQLASTIIYTQGKTPEEITEELLGRINQKEHEKNEIEMEL